MKPDRTLVRSALWLVLATGLRADILVNESFTGYTAENLSGSAATGLGLTGSWNGSGYFKNQPTSLSMAGVGSSGGSVAINLVTVAGKTSAVELASPLPSTMLYGCYLFSTTLPASNARTVGGIGVGAASDNDNSASFAWSGNGYNSANSVEGPNIRSEGFGTLLPAMSLVDGQTYLMLFEFNGAEGTTSAWVLNEAQLANFHNSLDAETLNAAPTNTEDPTGVAWTGFIEPGPAVDPMTHLLLFGYTPNADGDIIFTWDEIRISDSGLLDAVVGPPLPPDLEITGVSGGPGAFTITYKSGGQPVTIERSTFGLDHFQPLSTGETSGSYVDESAPAGKAFYRIALPE
ncbi:hypothetical protein [Haloferula sargassicola]|uniref:Uncharacterized protein n=1 Tax=Haloferula sargassicola TaxID=490096 RepID=A0ABP9UQ95_9BACT